MVPLAALVTAAADVVEEDARAVDDVDTDNRDADVVDVARVVLVELVGGTSEDAEVDVGA